MKDPFELMPLIVAVVVGAIAFQYFDPSDESAMTHGALTGAAVQITVRLLGVS